MDTLQFVETETSILTGLLKDTNYFNFTIHSLKPKYFIEQSTKTIIEAIKQIDHKPNIQELGLVIKEMHISKDEKDKAITRLKEVATNTQNIETKLLMDITSKYLQKNAMTDAIMKAVDIIKKDGDFQEIVNDMTEAVDLKFEVKPEVDFFDLEKRMEYYEKKLIGLPSGIKQLDRVIGGGFFDGTLNLFFGASHSGKSVMLTSIATNIFKSKKNVLFYTLEMTDMEILKRVDANLLNRDVNTIKDLDKETYKSSIQAIRPLLGVMKVIGSTPGALTPSMIKRDVEDFRNHGLLFDAIVIDYLGLMGSTRVTKKDNSYNYFKVIAEELFGLSKTLPSTSGKGLPIISAGQLNRSGYNNIEAGMDSVSESMGPVHSADLAIMINANEELRAQNQVMLNIQKNRNAGFLGNILVRTNFNLMRYEDLVPENM